MHAADDWAGALRARLAPTADHRPDHWRVGALRVAHDPLLASLALESLTPAAVLVPVVDRPEGPSVLFTVRAAHLRQHAGQISFPGGRLEGADADALGAALREAQEEVGIAADWVEPLGYLPDHVVLTGFLITPIVGRVRPRAEPRLDRSEVAGVFEVPLGYVLEPANYRSVRRRVREHEIDATELPYGEHRIWGATAAILTSLYQLMRGGLA
ncbi:MAG: CoA pyrophosphatase [Gammaproteobacteria bacterium]|nr:CoA pyrophosphatase [Gammaproteobacteria bacterium]